MGCNHLFTAEQTTTLEYVPDGEPSPFVRCRRCGENWFDDLRTENAALTLALAESHRVLRGALRCVTECGCGACQRNIKAILATTPTPSEKAGKVCENPRHDCPCPECAPTNPNRV